MIQNLILNAALLVTLATFHNLLTRERRKDKLWAKLVSGSLFGIVAIIGMHMPFRYSPGIIYDDNSIVMVLAGLFGGGATSLVSLAVAGAYRVYLGGNGIWAGLSTIVSCVVIGLFFRRFAGNRPDRLSIPALYGIGVLAHLVMLTSQLFIFPWPTEPSIIGKIWVPVIVMFPIATMLMGILLRDAERHIRMEAALLESEEKFRTITALSPAAIAILKSDEQGERFLYVNEAWETMTGYSTDEAIQLKPKDILHPDLRERITEQAAARIHGGDVPSRYENKIITKNGETKWLDFAAAIIQYQGRRAILTMALDIAERKRAEEKLIESEERLALVMEGSQLGYWDWNIKTGEVRRNARWAEMLGYTLPEIELNVKQWADFQHPDDKAAAWRSIQDHLEGRTPEHRIEYRMQCKNGEYKWILDQARVVERDAQGKPLRMSGTHTDITERKRAEEELNEREQLFRTLFESSPNAILLLDPHNPDISWPILDCNEEACRMNGYTREELVGQSIDLLNVTPGDKEERSDYVNHLRQKGTVYLETFHRRKDGSIFPIEVTTSFVTVRNRELLLGIDRDITERKQAEEALRVNEERFRNIFENAPIGMAMVNASFNFIKTNAVFCKMFGYTHKEFESLSFKEITHPEHLPQDIVNVKKLTEGEIEVYKTEKRYLKKDGQILWGNLTLSKSLDETGRLKYYLAMIEDISKRKVVEEHLRESEERLRVATEVTQIGIWDWNLEKDIWYASPTYYTMLGYQPVSGSSDRDVWLKRVHPGDMKAVASKIKKVLEGTNTSYQYEARMKHADGSYKWHSVIGSAVENNKHGKPIRMMGVRIDITNLKQVEQALRQSEERKTIFNEIANIFLSYPDEEMYGKVLDVVLRVINSQFGVFGFIAANGDLVIPSMTRDIWDKCQIPDKSIVFPQDTWGSSLWGKAIRGKKTLFSSGPFQTPTGHIPIEYFLSVPVVYANEVIGLISVANKEKGYIDKDKDLLEGIAQYISPILKARMQRDREETVRKLAEEALKASEQWFRQLADTTSTAITIYQGERFVYANQAASILTGYTLDELNRLKFWDLIHPDLREISRERGLARQQGENVLPRYELNFIHKDGTERWIDYTAGTIDWNGKPAAIGTAFDITERKNAEEKIQQDLKEKEVLLQEIHHRVKNNLSVMSSLLNLQAGRVKTKQQALEAFKESRDRVYAMALVHEKLYQSSDFTSVDMKSYLDDMSHQLINIYNITKNIQLTLDVENINIDINRAIPCGLVLNELITNAFKHAFPNQRKGKISVSLKVLKDASYELIVADDGIGIPENVDVAESESLGLNLIKMLSKQLNATWTLKQDEGTLFRIVIPNKK